MRASVNRVLLLDLWLALRGLTMIWRTVMVTQQSDKTIMLYMTNLAFVIPLLISKYKYCKIIQYNYTNSVWE